MSLFNFWIVYQSKGKQKNNLAKSFCSLSRGLNLELRNLLMDLSMTSLDWPLLWKYCFKKLNFLSKDI